MTKTVKPDPRYGGPRLRPLYAAVLSALAACHAAASEVESGSAPLTIAQVEFDQGFFPSGSSVTNDLSRFEKGNSVLPGTYNVDIYVNDNWIGRADVLFKASETTRSGDARACFDKLLLTRVGIDLAKLAPETAKALAAPGACLPLERIVDGATIALDFGEQRLDLGIQQASLSRNPRGYVSREFWSDGVNAGFLGYDANVYAYNNRGAGTQTQGYLGLNAGVNLGAWHFRHNGSYSWSSQGNAQYQSLNTYLQRDVPALLSQLIAGESYTTGELFDSVGFRGVRLSTDDRMLPDSLRGYAPTVRGIANSNAKVTIKQNGAIIYDTTVAPGAFEINDLYATGYGGDLTVEVTESDGSVHSFKVPYASVPLSLRPGISRYSITAGTLRDTMTSGNPWFTQGTWQRGFTNAVTGYVGATIAQGYGSAMVGGVLTTGIGAIGVDYTQAITTVPGAGRMTGGSARISYSKNVPQTGSNISIAAYRYSTGGFFDLGAAMQARDAADRGTTGIESVVRPRNRAQITFGQQLGERGGNLSLTASTVNYWNRGGSDINYSVGYSNTFRNVSLSLQATRQQSALGQQSTLYYASVTIPLGRQYPMTMSSSVSHDTNGRTQVRSMLSGSLGVDRNLSYGVNLNHSSGDGSSDTSGSANMLYRGRLADVSASAGSGSGNSQGSFGVRGAVVAHPGGRHAVSTAVRNDRRHRGEGRRRRARTQRVGGQARQPRLRRRALPDAVQHEFGRDRPEGAVHGRRTEDDKPAGRASRGLGRDAEVRDGNGPLRGDSCAAAEWRAAAVRLERGRCSRQSGRRRRPGQQDLRSRPAGQWRAHGQVGRHARYAVPYRLSTADTRCRFEGGWVSTYRHPVRGARSR